jgi:hypothetical protein
MVAGALAALALLWPRAGSPGWTGAAVAVPSCPADAGGCRMSVVKWSEAGGSGPVVAQEDWSGSPATLKVVIPSGTYAVSAEGCTGYRIEDMRISVTPGFHAAIDLGLNWELIGAVARGCPGFKTAP